MDTNQAFDPTYGYDLDALLQVPSPDGPADFEDFWRRSYDEARSIPTNIARRQIESSNPNLEIYEIEFDSLGGFRAGGWLTVPADGNFERGAIIGHGYGGRDAPDLDLVGPPAVALFACARGFHRSPHPEMDGTSGVHVLHGIESRETYSHRGSCADNVWCAANVLLELFPQVAANLHYLGGSFGGGIGAMAVPWDTRFKKAYLDVPSFGNHPLRVTLPCFGSGEAVRLCLPDHPEIMEVLAYFDAATAARHFEIPTFVAAALADPAVPPPGQFAVYNAIPERKELFVRQTGHPDTESDGPPLWAQLNAWLAD